MGDPVASFAVDLETAGAVAGAKAAASAMEGLRGKIQEDEAALRSLQQALGRIKGAKVDVGDQTKALSTQMGALKANIATNQGVFMKLGGNLGELSKKSDGASASGKKLGDSMKGAGNSAQSSGEQFSMSWAEIAKGAAVAAVAVGAAIGAFTRFALLSWDHIRTQRITAEAFTGSAFAADQLASSIRGMEGGLPQTREGLQSIAQSLSEGGLSGRGMATALHLVATAAAVLPSAAAKLQSLAASASDAGKLLIGKDSLKGTGVTIDAIAAQLGKSMRGGVAAAKRALQTGGVELEAGLKALDGAVQDRFGDLAKRAALSAPAQWEKLKESIGGLFSSVAFEPALKALSKLTELLDESSTTGKALRELFATMFESAGSGLAELLPLVGGFMRGLLEGALLVQSAWKAVQGVLAKVFPAGLMEKIGGAKIAFYGGVTAAILFAAAVGLATVALTVLAVLAVGLVLALATPFIIVGGIIGGLIYVVVKFGSAIMNSMGRAFAWVGKQIKKALDAIRGFNLADAASSIIGSLVDGLASAGKAVLSAVIGVGRSIGTALSSGVKSALGIHSPSKVAIEIGTNFSTSMGMGVERGAPAMHEATADLFPRTDGRAEGSRVTNNSRATTVNLVVNGVGGAELSAGARALASELRRTLNSAGAFA